MATAPKKEEQTSALTVFDPGQFALLTMDERGARRVQRMLRGITINLLPKITITNNGQFNIPDQSRKSGQRTVDAEDGIDVILLATNMNYRSAFEGGYDPNAPRPPLCWSHTGEVGEGAFKGQPCVTCRLHNTYEDEAARKGGCWGKGQSIVLIPGDELPYQFQIPLTGLKTFRQYLFALGMKRDIFEVLTRLTVQKEGQHVRVKGRVESEIPTQYYEMLNGHALAFESLLNGPGAPADPGIVAPAESDYEGSAARVYTEEPAQADEDADTIEI